MRNYSVPIVLAFTPNYFVPACTTLMSVLKNSDPCTHFEVICLLTTDLSADLRKKLEDFAGARMQFNYINLSGRLEGIYVDERYTIAASFRLLIPLILETYEKVIYLDCDIIVQHDLGKLYREQMLGNHYLAGVFEAPLDFQLAYLKKLGIDPGYYMNSGFLLMNLALMRQDHIVDRFMTASKVDYLQFPDQDVLNQVCKGRILALEPAYNAIRTFYLPQYKNNFLARYSPQQWDAVQKKGNIHYTGAKPWDKFTVRYSDWWYYYYKLPRTIRQNLTVSFARKIISCLFLSKKLGDFSNKILYIFRNSYL